MNNPKWIATLVLVFPVATSADPLHARPGGDYWHHDSGWVFPQRIGEFTRVGVPQDVAGSSDAIAHYAREISGQRVVASVEVIAATSAVGHATLDGARAAFAVPSRTVELPLGVPGYTAVRLSEEAAPDRTTRLLYFVTSGEWRVRILFEMPGNGVDTTQPDQFVRAQRWDTLP